MGLVNVAVRSLAKVQIGPEAIPGDDVPATVLWLGPASRLVDGSTINYVEQDVGNLTGFDHTYKPAAMAAYAMPDAPTSFQHCFHIYDGSMQFSAGVADGAGSDFIRIYNMPGISQQTIKTFTIEAGDNVETESTHHAFVSQFNHTMATDETFMQNSAWIGQVIDPTFGPLTSLTVDDVERINSNQFKLFIDDVSGTIGSTEILGFMNNFTIEYISGWVPTPPRSGNLFWTDIKQGGVASGLSMVITMEMEVNAFTLLEKANATAQVPRMIRLIAEGSDFTMAGTDFDKHTWQLDAVGKWAVFSEVADNNGNRIYTVAMQIRNNVESGLNAGVITVVNEIA